MNKLVKVISILMIAVTIIAISMPVFAAPKEEVAGGLKFPISDPKTGTGTVLEVAGKIIGLIRWVSIVAGVVIITIFGLKYMMGSLEEKADYKKSFIPLIVGIVIVMSSSVIASIIISTFQR